MVVSFICCYLSLTHSVFAQGIKRVFCPFFILNKIHLRKRGKVEGGMRGEPRGRKEG